MMKNCTKCGIEKELTEFHASTKHSTGRKSRCKECVSQAPNNYYIQNKSKINSRSIEWRKSNPERFKEIKKLYRTNNKESIAAYDSKWNKDNPYSSCHLGSRRRARGQLLISITHKEAIKEIYKNCPVGHHVDHIVPLNGKLVSGFHVPWNMQYLSAEANMRKGNRA